MEEIRPGQPTTDRRYSALAWFPPARAGILFNGPLTIKVRGQTGVFGSPATVNNSLSSDGTSDLSACLVAGESTWQCSRNTRDRGDTWSERHCCVGSLPKRDTQKYGSGFLAWPQLSRGSPIRSRSGKPRARQRRTDRRPSGGEGRADQLERDLLSSPARSRRKRERGRERLIGRYACTRFARKPQRPCRSRSRSQDCNSSWDSL